MRLRHQMHAPHLQPFPILVLPMIPVLLTALCLYLMMDVLSTQWHCPLSPARHDSTGDPAADSFLNGGRLSSIGIRAYDPRAIIGGSPLRDGIRPHYGNAAIWHDLSGELHLVFADNTILTSLALQVDGDDIYIVESSQDGLNFVTIGVIPAGLRGEHSGMETYSSDPDSHYYIRYLNIPPGHYPYLRIRAVAGTPPFALSRITLRGHQRR